MSYYKADIVREVAKGNWLFILSALAPYIEPALHKLGRHVSCPIHGGKNGFRLFKDVHQTGGGVCNTCGVRHDGFELLMWLNNWDFKRCLSEVGDYLGVKKEEPIKESKKDCVTNTLKRGLKRTFESTVTQFQVRSKKQSNQTKPKVVPIFREQPKPWLLELQEAMEKKVEHSAAYSDRIRKKIEEVWNECILFSSPTTEPMRLYFQNRGLLFNVEEIEKSDSLRFNPEMPYYDEDGNKVGKFPTIVCAIRDIDGNLVTLQRTYLTLIGKKAKVDHVKKMMPIPKGLDVNGAAIRLGEPTEGILGVAEGLESALSAYRITQIPVWSTVNATLMKSFEVPEGIHTVLIWADKDRSVTGEKSANVLKAKLEKRGIQVYVLLPKPSIPPTEKGIDWNDVLMSEGNFGFPNPLYLRDFIARRRAEYIHH